MLATRGTNVDHLRRVKGLPPHLVLMSSSVPGAKIPDLRRILPMLSELNSFIDLKQHLEPVGVTLIAHNLVLH